MRISDWSSDVCSSDLEPTGIHVTHDMFDAVECDAGIGGIMHGKNDAGDELNNQRNARENTEIPEIVQVPRDRVASTNSIIDQTRQRKDRKRTRLNSSH